jgi:hypothetical protein
MHHLKHSPNVPWATREALVLAKERYLCLDLGQTVLNGGTQSVGVQLWRGADECSGHNVRKIGRGVVRLSVHGGKQSANQGNRVSFEAVHRKWQV